MGKEIKLKNKKKIIAVDLFCGAGGESTGLQQAAETLGMNLELLAINHWDIAINTHSINHKYANHMCESVQSVDPLKAVPSGKLDLLWASPECTHFSNARGGKPKSDQSRASVEMIITWLEKLDVKKIIIENVREFKTWGPLDKKNQPIKSRKGEFFRDFLLKLENLGYKTDHRILCAADYGDPTTRQRFFLQGVKTDDEIKWPEYSHTKKGDLFSGKRWKPAKDIIDWSIPGESIFTRKIPLVPNTISRIEAGIEKFWGEWAEPFLIILRGTSQSHINNSALKIDNPLPTITASGTHIALIEPFMIQMNGTKAEQIKSSAMPLSRPIPTITAGGLGKVGLIKPFIVPYYGCSKYASINDPLDTVTTKDRFALIQGNPYLLDITYRMFQPHELSAGHSFPLDYVFTGTKTQVVKQVGNSVPVKLAKALCCAILN